MFKKAITVYLVLQLIATFTLTVYFSYCFMSDLLFLSKSIFQKTVENTKRLAIPEAEEDHKSLTFLVYGIDSGEWVDGSFRPGHGRADTILLLRVYPETVTASLLSIPRDTLVTIPGRSGEDKINHAYAFGQVDLLVETVEQFSGLIVDYYMGLNYLTVKEVVDIFGGIEFDLDRNMEAHGIILEQGFQLFEGDQAFAMVSFRHEPLGDIGRVIRQHRFIRDVAAQAATKPIDQLFAAMLVAWNNIETDADFLTAAKLASLFKKIEDENIIMDIVPGRFYEYEGISYWKPDLIETTEIINRLFLSDETVIIKSN